MSLQLLRLFSKSRLTLYTQIASCSGSDKSIPKSVLEKHITGNLQPDNGAIYDKKPFKLVCEKGKKYSWCLCGKSKSQPLCDGTHKNVFLKIKIKPVRFEVAETKAYYLCNCKQTSNRPFCDGTHKQVFVQDAVRS